LSDIEELVLPPKGEGTTRPVYHLYTIRTKQRESLRVHLEKNAVECGVNYTLPIHLQPAYKEKFGFKEGAFPNSEELCKTCLSIPMYPDLSEKEVQFVCDQIHQFFENR
jgi:dTDP-4-amino-4,6-dideoxygalactose transaminase